MVGYAEQSSIDTILTPDRGCQLSIRVKFDISGYDPDERPWSNVNENNRRLKDYLIGELNVPIDVVSDPSQTWVLFGGQVLDGQKLADAQEAVQAYADQNPIDVSDQDVVVVGAYPTRQKPE